MQISLEGKVALVTGASKGIGKAIAATLAASGADVMLVSRKIDQLEAAAAEIRESGASGRVAVMAANVGDADSATTCVSATIEQFGGLDILVNNAAANPYYGPTLEVDQPRFDKTFQVNLRGPLFWSAAAWDCEHLEVLHRARVGGLDLEHLAAGELGELLLRAQDRQRAIEPARVELGVEVHRAFGRLRHARGYKAVPRAFQPLTGARIQVRCTP